MIHRLHEMIGSHHRTHHGRVERHHVPHRVPLPQPPPHGAQQEQPLRTAAIQPHAGTHAAGEAGLLRVVPMAHQRCRGGFCSTDGCGAAVCGQGDPPSSGSGCDVKLIYSSPLQLICGLCLSVFIGTIIVFRGSLLPGAAALDGGHPVHTLPGEDGSFVTVLQRFTHT